ncbi:MAG: tRNA (N(6)-L-threonylcarbamoyladenosine(37)-C(2))-methylthiotransferase MtaB [Spirochaetae bacterium HGW-Spirochaetae-9]|nr:MAG: tRNA (N(6)-L-threonylcarbamoyladenosine(37)-C(2))-methylthiotransferase MtaB [Spirochaetae bacterium HGW-Spirochaetae-9]
MRLLKVAFHTLGCKLNQLETESVADAFEAAGAIICPFSEEADLYVVNSCTVTSKAEQKARRVMRQALVQNPQAVVLVTGCYAQMDPEGLSLVHPRALVLPGDEKPALLALASWLQDNWQGHGDLHGAVGEWRANLQAVAEAPPDRFAFHPRNFAFHSRPSLKIEDGCNNRCAYCRVCLARGPAVSLPADRILERVLELEKAGKAEVVLTGINLAQYRDGTLRFPGLLSRLIEGTDSIRFRISSWEPEFIDDAFLRAFANLRVQPHVHLSLQSGSDSVLRRMARPYTAAWVAQAVADLRATRDDPFLAADVIAGFPGESAAEFEASIEFCRAMDFAWIHAFPFSARPGTKAFDMVPKVPERLAGERVARLGALASAGKSAYLRRWIGKTVPLILEKGDEGQDTGTTANYLKATVEGIPANQAPGALLSVTLTGPAKAPGADVSALFSSI